MGENQIIEIKIIRTGYDSLVGVQKTQFGVFLEQNERYQYIGNHTDNEIVRARLIYQALYPGDQWANMPDSIAENTERKTRRVYVDA